MQRLDFRIEGMCCGEEVSVLKKAVAPLVGGAANLDFDLLDRRMTVRVPEGEVDAERIATAVALAGMRAVPWTQACTAPSCSMEEGAWALYGRRLTCALSGLLMLSGLALQAFLQGSLPVVLAHGGVEGTAVPPGPVALYFCSIAAGAWFVLPRAYAAVQRLRPDMNLLMICACLGAIWLGQWLEAASVTFLFSLALLLESWSIGRARRAIQALLDIVPATARFICPKDGDIEEKPVAEIPVGTVVLVRPGEKIPLDGVVLRGSTSVNQAPITGESMPVAKNPGNEVFAGTINGEGAIEFRSTKPAADTTLSHIIRLVEETRCRRAPTEQWIEKFARVYTPAMMLAALLIALLPPILLAEPWSKWFYQALVILVIACPCSLVISTPVSIVAGLASAARHGVLIKGGAFLEAPATLKVVAFDKTGTLTRGRPVVRQIVPLNDHTESELLANAAALESHSTHPLARAIVSHAESSGIRVVPAGDFTILPGQGAKGTLDGKTYWIGSHRMLAGGEENPRYGETARQMENRGHSVVAMWCEDHVCGLMGLSDEVRAEAPETVRALKRIGIERTVMMTGDNRHTARQVAEQTGVDECMAELLPEGKVEMVEALRKNPGPVAMVGDGVNDAPAMAAADVSIAMGAMGTDAAIETADIALMSDDLSRIPWLISHSRHTLRVIKQNIVFSLGLKAAFFAMALCGFATLWGAIAADMGASLLVIFNGLRLLKQ
ncbi:MAG: heavy metal translocating P-type ATPase [Syntrophobacteraceae bacterium]|nr:cadmium-translocating P-type ATPase [Desulfobacteraceae bacterium]